ncbi:acyl-CoA dehydrogenase family protein [Microbacterium profundi]|uniref:Acyl-CoA dehydrogenase family protein n=1 Tax=Microbacterium profundi TaxID=450380 RepID=A0ABV3LKD0_9MICO|nr:acyl-CoA dehydrogenase family protein [Microbacterium profundi]
MQFELSEDQLDFQKSLRRMISDRSPMKIVREVIETEPGWDEGLWRQFAEQAGLPALLVPEEYDGAGASLVEAMIVMEELGRGLVPSPFFATTAFGVVPILTFGSESQKQDLLPGIVAGEITATTAITEPSGNWSPDGVEMAADGSDDSVTLTGTKSFVIDGHTANKILVVARSGDQYGLYVVDGDAPGLSRTKQTTLDLTRPMATLEFDNVAATALGEPGSWDRISHMIDVAATLLAAEMVGAMEAAMTMAVEYAKVRNQFSRAIGSFQGIKHRLSEMALEVDTSRAATWYAAHAGAEELEDFPTAALVAKATAAAGFAFTASWVVQVHGGIGFTWDHDAQLYYRKAKSTELLLGSTADTWLQLADRLGV